MKNKKFAEKVIGLTLVLALTASFTGCAAKSSNTTGTVTGTAQADTATVPLTYTAAPKTVKKAETVYVNMDNSGAVTQTTVSDWLHTDSGEVRVSDITDLSEIENVKSDISPVFTEGSGLDWNMNTTDLYYRGTSTKTLPVSIDIHYYLNGSELSAEEIKGQSGDVQIKITYTNNVFETVKIDGKDVKIYNPLVVLGLVILPETQFSGTAIDGGRLIGDGAKEIAVMVGLPGLNETLGLDKLASVAGLDSMSFSNTFTISAKASAFTLGNLYFAAVPLSTVASDIDMPDSIGDLKSDLVKLKKLECMVQTIDPNDLLSSLLSDSSKITELTGVVDDALTLYDENKKLLEMLPKYFTKENMDALQQLLTTMNSDDVQDMLELLKSPILQNFITVLPTLTSELDEVTPMIEGLNRDLQDPEIAASIGNLPDTLNKLDQIQKTVDDNQELINALTTLTSGENMEKLDELMDTLSDSDLIDKLSDYGALTDDAAGLLGRLQAMIAFGKQYKIFTTAPDNMQTSVMFIFNTPSIR